MTREQLTPPSTKISSTFILCVSFVLGSFKNLFLVSSRNLDLDSNTICYTSESFNATNSSNKYKDDILK